MISAGSSHLMAALVAGTLATTALAPSAFAQGKGGAAAAKADKGPDKKTRDAARKAYGDGEKAYTAGDYSKALDNFKKAYELIPTPHAQFWIGMSLAQLNRGDEAVKELEALLANPDASKIGDDKIAEAKKKLDELKSKMVGEVSIATTPPGAQVTVDGQPQMGESPMTLKLTPGRHKISVAASGYESKEMEIEIKAGDKLDQKIELAEKAAAGPATPPPEPAPAPVTPPPEPAAPPAEKKSKVPAYVTLGIAGAGAVVGTFFGIKALGAKSDYDANPTTDLADDVERNALIADMAFGVAITLGVTGIVLLTSSDEPAKEGRRALPKQAKLRVAPYVTHEGGGASARLTF
jgi:hypothetical protein